MANAEMSFDLNGRRRRTGNPCRKLKIDMTPMVDLGFLLITFFIFTSSMNIPATMDLLVPEGGPGLPVSGNGAITVLIGAAGRIALYEGLLAPDKSNVRAVPMKELRDALIKKKERVTAAYMPDAACEKRIAEGKTTRADCRQSSMMVVIKPGPDASYSTVVDVLDEMTINKIARYALTDPEEADLPVIP